MATKYTYLSPTHTERQNGTGHHLTSRSKHRSSEVAYPCYNQPPR